VSWWRWLRRRREPGPPGADAAAESAVIEVGRAIAPVDPWRPLAGEFGLRLLTLTWEAAFHIGEAEESESDPERRAVLYRIDHAITRTRRLAENLRVLAGESVDDPDRRAITLQDIAYAAGASVEHYERLRFGPVADLAVSADAADDVIRILTELLDNADRYSPSDEPVSVAGHLTGDGEVLLRVEDSGIGIPPQRLESINHLLSEDAGIRDADLRLSHVGLPVVAVLTGRHPGLRARLSSRHPTGTVAMLRVGPELLCEASYGGTPEGWSPPARPRHARPAVPGVPARPQVIPHPRGDAPARPGHDLDGTARLPVTGTPLMPRRVPGSIRTAPPPAPPVRAAAYPTSWQDDAEAFNAGVDAARRGNPSPLEQSPSDPLEQWTSDPP
jgi:histidine kinase/DNA gyrase B/HSP90-like ATPase